MKQLLLLILSISTLQLVAQDYQIPRNEKTELAEYVEVIEDAKGTASELHQRALEWIKEEFKNPTQVLQSDDETTLEIKGKARFRITFTDKKENTTPAGFVAYKFTLQFKDGKFRYVIDHIRWEQPSYFDVSRWENPDDSKYKEEVWPSYVEQTVAYFEQLTDSMVEFVSYPEEEESTDW